MKETESKSTYDLSKTDPKCAEWMDDCIKRLYNLKVSPENSIASIMSIDEITAILRLIEPILMEENSLLEVQAPIKIIGDLHADFDNLMRLFGLIGKVPKEKLLFLGNYVDMGMDGIEVTLMLFCLKIRYRDRIFLLRGNHETPGVNKCCFNRLPMACLISQKVLCMHGGLSPELTTLNKIRSIERPNEPISSGLEMDLLWADPTNRGDGWFQSYRGISYLFGKQVVEQACKRLKITLIIRSHMVISDGFEVMTGRRLITVFSASNYAGTVHNSAAVLCVNEKLGVTHQKLTPISSLSHPSQVTLPTTPLTADLDSAIANYDMKIVKRFVKF
ncbi:hypothetical protein GCK72_013186 [Caenorhabditis remanei]|uniref:Serine/threonine-protein phosphatase n=1 Tax=Caenorhabditis remanei TaxID=31234 RepID=A0A6A5GQS7_CAERE|nr:hypothetical protein GCK72_013186 [Caenorhabditis remanei]KAF1756732.1 hypothetical protein GCK72_013186 [Caenorhabditis remanei]